MTLESEAVDHYRQAHTPSAPFGMPAHITILWPFLDAGAVDGGVEDELARIASRFAPFDFAMNSLEAFPTAVYLSVEPADQFVSIIEAVWGRWPDHPPYGGAYEPLPHLTVAEDGTSLAEAAPVIEPLLPLRARAQGLSLLVPSTNGEWLESAVFPFGSGVS